METIAKKLGNRSDVAADSSKPAKPRKFGTLLASLALCGMIAASGGCGDKSTTNNNYYGPDGGKSAQCEATGQAGAAGRTASDGSTEKADGGREIQDAGADGAASEAGAKTLDAGQDIDAGADSAVSDAANETLDATAENDAGNDAQNVTCSRSPGPELACGGSSIGGILNSGEALPVGNLAIQLDDIEVADNGNSALISVVDLNCNTLAKDKIREGTTVTVAIGAETYDVRAAEIGAGYTFGATWASIEVNAGGCGGDAGSNACAIASEPAVSCSDPAIEGVLNQGQRMPFGNLAIELGDLEVIGDEHSAIISILDANCNILKKDKIGEGNTVTMSIAGELYDVTVVKTAAGYTFGERWADINITASGCPLTCEPWGGCGGAYDTVIVTLGEGESFTSSGITVNAVEITENVGTPSGDICPISNENVTLKLSQPGRELTTTLAEEGCDRTGDACYSVKVLEITEDVGAAVYPPDGGTGTCPISNEKARLELKVPK